MQVIVPPEMEAFVADEVSGGRFPSAADVVREGLQLLRERQQKLEALRRDVDVAIAEADAGLAVPLDDALASDIKARGRARLQPNRAGTP